MCREYFNLEVFYSLDIMLTYVVAHANSVLLLILSDPATYGTLITYWYDF